MNEVKISASYAIATIYYINYFQTCNIVCIINTNVFQYSRFKVSPSKAMEIGYLLKCVPNEKQLPPPPTTVIVPLSCKILQ